jgi:hypothetical protein
MNPATLVDWFAVIIVLGILLGMALVMIGCGIWVIKRGLMLGKSRSEE